MNIREAMRVDNRVLKKSEPEYAAAKKMEEQQEKYKKNSKMPDIKTSIKRATGGKYIDYRV